MKTETLCPHCYANHYALVDVKGEHFICQECKRNIQPDDLLAVEYRPTAKLSDYSMIEFYNYDQHWVEGKRTEECVITRELIRDMRFIRHACDIIHVGKFKTQLIAVTNTNTLIVKRLEE